MKFKYKVLNTFNENSYEIMEEMNGLGEQGYDLAGVKGDLLFFKRQVVEAYSTADYRVSTTMGCYKPVP